MSRRRAPTAAYARAVAFGLRERGVEVTVTARTLERAQRIAEEVGCKVVDWESRHRIPHDCIVNAYMVVFDTVYNPENTLLIKEARSVGCRTVSGVEMFVKQAAQQFTIWHGSEAPEGVMRDALKRATASAKLPD